MDATRSEYRQLALSREGSRFYRLTLALTLVVTLLGAVSLGFYLSDRLLPHWARWPTARAR